MLRSLKEVQADDNVIGFYQTMSLGSFYNQTLVDTQAMQQDRLRHGGIILVHGGLFPLFRRTYPPVLILSCIQTSHERPEATRHSVLSNSLGHSLMHTDATISARTGKFS